MYYDAPLPPMSSSAPPPDWTPSLPSPLPCGYDRLWATMSLISAPPCSAPTSSSFSSPCWEGATSTCLRSPAWPVSCSGTLLRGSRGSRWVQPPENKGSGFICEPGRLWPEPSHAWQAHGGSDPHHQESDEGRTDGSHLGSVIGLSAASLPRCHLVACNASRWCSHQSESVNRP